MLLKILCLTGFVLFPVEVFAWGPLTHMYIGNEVLSFSSFLPSLTYSVIKRYREDFLYGNIVADIVIGKKYLPKKTNPHTWDFGFRLLKIARKAQHKAFAYGYLCHLAADTVAHEHLTREKKNLQHTFYELKADSIVKKRHWFQAITIMRKAQGRNDAFLEHSLDRLFFSYKTNKRIFKSMVYMSLFTPKSVGNFIDRSEFITSVPEKREIERLRKKSLVRIIDLLEHGDSSLVLDKNPSGDITHGKIFRSLFVR